MLSANFIFANSMRSDMDLCKKGQTYTVCLSEDRLDHHMCQVKCTHKKGHFPFLKSHFSDTGFLGYPRKVDTFSLRIRNNTNKVYPNSNEFSTKRFIYRYHAKLISMVFNDII